MFGFINNAYNRVRKVFGDFSRAYSFKREELKPAYEFFDKRETSYLKSLIDLEKKKELDDIIFDDANKTVRDRFYSNFWRVLSGKELIQDEEDSLGIAYSYVGSSSYKKKRFIVKDSDKYSVALKNLESKLENSSSSACVVEPAKNSENVFAKYISDFRDDCFTNSLARISSEYSGSVSAAANVLAGYVSSGSEDVVSPHTRSWSSRVSNLEDVLSKSKFSFRDKSKLLEIKSALSKNKYLVSKRKKEYVRAVNLINSAIRKSKEVVCYAE